MARTREVARKAYRKAVVLSSYLGQLERLEKDLIPLAVRNTPVAEAHRAILVALYLRRVPMLIYKARQGTPAERKRARLALTKIGVRGMAPLLEQLANPTTPFSRKQQLIRMLGYLGNENAVGPLLRIAGKEPVIPPLVIRPHGSRYYRSYRNNTQIDLRVAATIAVGRLASKRATKGLLALLKSSEGALREAAAWALGRQRDAKAGKALFAALGDSRNNVQVMACIGLGVQGEHSLRPVLEEVMLDDERHPDVRAACAWGLGALGDRRAAHALATALRSGHDALQRSAAWALGALGDDSAVPLLLEALWSRKPSVRRAMLWALARSVASQQLRVVSSPDIRLNQGKVDRHALLAHLTDVVDHLRPAAIAHALASDAASRQHTAAALARGVKTALQRHRDVLLEVLSDLDSARDSLALGPLTAGANELSANEKLRITKLLRLLAQAIAPELAKLLTHSDPLVASRATSIFLKLDRPNAPATIMAIWPKMRWRSQLTALEVLARQHRRPERAKLFELAAHSPSWRVREIVAKALGDLDPAVSRKLARRLQSDDNGFVRAALAARLHRLPLGEGQLLRRAFADPLREVRQAAFRSVTAHRIPGIVRQLRRLAADKQGKVSQRANRALKALSQH
jgi:HEAT repeat protein